MSRPFHREIDKIHLLYGGEGKVDDTYLRTISNTDRYGIISFLHHRLIENNLVDFKEETLSTTFQSLDIRSAKILRVLDQGFSARNIKSQNIGDLVNIVVKKCGKFDLGNLRSREISCIYGKLHDLGVILDIHDDTITDITFKRR